MQIKQAMVADIAACVNIKTAAALEKTAAALEKTAATYTPWQKLVTEALAKGEAWAMPALKRSLNASELSKILPMNAKTMAKNMSRAEAARAAIKANIPEAGKRVFTGGPGSFAGAGYTNPAGRFAPKAAPELNQVQSVGNPLLRKFKYEGLI